MRGSRVFVNTYWVRYPYVGVSFDRAVENTRVLFRAAVEAGAERLVHVSVSNPSPDSPLGYYRGKAQAEEVVRSMGVPYAIVRPTLVVGQHDILVNNIAWFLRRFPFFAVPGSGRYRLQPVTSEDVGEIIANVALSGQNLTIDAAGPDILTFEQFVGAVATAIGRNRRLVHLPAWLTLQLIRPVGYAMGEVVLSREELAGLMTELLISHEPPLGRQSVLGWLNEHGPELGRVYASEFRRHVA
jgi:NADH dehydrogenase